MTFNLICASHDDQILNKNLAASPFYKTQTPNNLKIIKGGTNVAIAYNLASKLVAPGDYFVYAHHDVFMPLDFRDNLEKAITTINAIDPGWGVLGLAGASMDYNGARKFYGHVRDRGVNWKYGILPQEVQTLDELLVITKGDLTFDEQFDLHFYGADICLQATQQGRNNYAISAYCHHNSGLKMGFRSESFKACEQKFKEKWKDWLPISTTCVLIK